MQPRPGVLVILPIPVNVLKRDDANVVEYDPGGYSGTHLEHCYWKVKYCGKT